MSWDTMLTLLIVAVAAFVLIRWVRKGTKPVCHADCSHCQCSKASTATITTQSCHAKQQGPKAT